MASGMEIGGDGSVAWKVVVDNVRRSSIVSKAVGGCGYLQSGVDETDDGQKFSIGIRIPRDREDGFALARALQEAAKDVEAHVGDSDHRVTFPLRIEPKNETQIRIEWESRAPKMSSPFGKGGRTLAIVSKTKAKARPKAKPKSKMAVKKAVAKARPVARKGAKGKKKR